MVVCFPGAFPQSLSVIEEECLSEFWRLNRWFLTLSQSNPLVLESADPLVTSCNTVLVGEVYIHRHDYMNSMVIGECGQLFVVQDTGKKRFHPL